MELVQVLVRAGSEVILAVDFGREGCGVERES